MSSSTPGDPQVEQLRAQLAAIEQLLEVHERTTVAESERAERAGAEVKLERARLSEMFQRAPALISVTRGPDHVFELANPPYLNVVGTRDILGKPLREALPEVAGQGFEDLLTGVYQSGEPYRGNEVRVLLDRAGTGTLDEGFFNFVYQPLRGSDGEVNGILTHAVEVTEQVQARERVEQQAMELEETQGELEMVNDELQTTNDDLRERTEQAEAARVEAERLEERYRALSRALAQIVWTAAADGSVEDIPDWRAYTGQSVAEVKGWGWLDVIHPADRERAAAEWSHSVQTRGKAIYNVEYRIRGADGAFRWFSTRGVPVLNDDGEVREWVGICIDIEERKRSETALREREEQFRTLANSIPQQVWTARPDGLLDYVNQVATDYFARPAEEVVEEGWQNVVHPDDLPNVVERWVHSLQTGERYAVEFRLRRHDGVYRWHLGQALPLRDDEGSIVRWFGTNTDIAEQREVEERQRFFADASALLNSSLDYELTLARVAEAAVPVLADWCAVDLLLPDDTTQRVGIAHPDPAKMELAAQLDRRYPPATDALSGVPHVLRTGEPELVAEIPDAFLEAAAVDAEHLRIIRALELRSYIIVPLIARGAVLGAITLVYAESGRRYAPDDLEPALELARRAAIAIDNARLFQEAEYARARVNRILESITDAFFSMDPDWRFNYVNREAEHLLARPASALLGKRIWDEFPEAVGSTFEERYRETARTQEAVLFEEFFPPLDTWFEVKAYPSADGVSVFFRNVNERHRMEQEREQLVEALETSNAELDQFAYVASHDLKAPLRGISNLATWIEEDLDDVLTPDTREQMNLLRNRVQRMEAMIDGVLQYSRAGEEAGSVQQVDTGALVAEVVELLAPPGEVKIEAQPDLPVLRTERLPLQQVLMNLVGNALKYGRPEDGLPRISISARNEGGLVEFTVADNGPGIDPRFHQKIFGVFQRLETREEVEGTGIGLSLVKKLVERRGGRVRVKSAPGEGTAFVFTWPAG